MDVAYINPFLAATSELFEKMIKVPLKLGRPALRKPEDRLYKLYRVSAVLELTGPVEGKIVLSFSQPVAFVLAGALAGQKFETIDAELLDAIAEIANMVVGGARSRLPGGSEIRISVPQVISTHLVSFPLDLPIMMIPFDTAAGRFIVETAIRAIYKEPGVHPPAPETKPPTPQSNAA